MVEESQWWDADMAEQCRQREEALAKEHCCREEERREREEVVAEEHRRQGEQMQLLLRLLESGASGHPELVTELVREVTRGHEEKHDVKLFAEVELEVAGEPIVAEAAASDTITMLVLLGTNVLQLLKLASFPDLPASFGMRSEAEGLVSQVT